MNNNEKKIGYLVLAKKCAYFEQAIINKFVYFAPECGDIIKFKSEESNRLGFQVNMTLEEVDLTLEHCNRSDYYVLEVSFDSNDGYYLDDAYNDVNEVTVLSVINK